MKSLTKKGYTIKNINEIDYIYTWNYYNGQQKWIYIGRADEYFKNVTEQKEQQAKLIFERIKKLEKKQEKIRAKIRKLKRQAEEILLDCLVG